MQVVVIANLLVQRQHFLNNPATSCFKGSVLIQLCNLRGEAAAEDDPGEVEPPPARSLCVANCAEGSRLAAPRMLVED